MNTKIKALLKAVGGFIDRVVIILDWRIKNFIKRIKKGRENKVFFRDVILVVLITCVLIATILVFWVASLKTPGLNSFDDKLLGQSAKIYDRTGTVMLYDLSQKVRRTVVPFDAISPYVKSATIAIEDVDFYNHGGIKYSSIIRAVLANVLSLHFSQGGSTITQQVIKNSLLTKEKTISRKLKEWVLSIKLEKTTDKDTILNMYLNSTSYGGNIYGIEEASQAFFDKKSSDLTLAESAYLAALPQAPSLYSPYGKNKNLLVDRKNLVLKKMFENKLISEKEYTDALKSEVVFQPKSVGGIKAPHFVMYIRDYLIQKYGEKILEEGGFKIISTLDWEMQHKAEDIVSNYVDENGKKYNASNAAMVATDPRTGQILVMVGSRDYFSKDIDGNFNVATARRQPGSSFKPFVYATAFNKGFTPDTPVYDVETEFNSSCDVYGKPIVTGANCYNPQNYEGGYKGLMSIRKALAESRNIPAVRVLHLVGVSDSIKLAELMGITNLGNADQYGLSLALGGGEVSLLDMTSAYGVFANSGAKSKLTGVLSIEDTQGKIIEEFSTTTKQVIPEQTALLMDDVLSDAYARASIFGSRYFGDRQVAIKTGTTNNSRDAWILGYTPSISVGAWMGNNNNTPMAQQASARIIGPMWKGFMDWVLTKIPDEKFKEPEPIASSTKPFLRGVWQGPGDEVHSELYWVNRNDPAGAAPGNASKDPLFGHFEYGVRNISGGLPITSVNTNPTGDQTQNSSFYISSPGKNSNLKRDERVFVTVSGITPDTSQIEYYINNKLIGKSTESPFLFSFIPSAISGIEDENELKAITTERLGKSKENTIFFSVI